MRPAPCDRAHSSALGPSSRPRCGPSAHRQEPPLRALPAGPGVEDPVWEVVFRRVGGCVRHTGSFRSLAASLRPWEAVRGCDAAAGAVGAPPEGHEAGPRLSQRSVPDLPRALGRLPGLACVCAASFLDACLPPHPPRGSPGAARWGVLLRLSIPGAPGRRGPLPAFCPVSCASPHPARRDSGAAVAGSGWGARASRAPSAPPAAGPGVAAPACFLSADAAAAADQPLSSSARPGESAAAPSACGFAINLYLSALHCDVCC